MTRRSATGRLLAALLAVSVGMGVANVARAGRDDNEVNLSSKEFEQLETFEAHSLQKADNKYSKGKVVEALRAYEAFIQTFDRSKVIAYAVLRKARCLHRDDKRYDAIKWYKEVLLYWPDQPKYAAAAKYYIGQCHWQNGDVEKAMTAWKEMADDKDYSKHRLAADAINKLAGWHWDKGQYPKANVYYKQVAVDFRDKNRGASNHAMDRVVNYYLRLKPDEPALREFYKNVRTFDHHRTHKVPEDLTDNFDYWNTVRREVEKHGRFDEDRQGEARDYYQYWAAALEGKFPKNDTYQIDLAKFHLRADGDKMTYVKQLDDQFESYQEPGDWDRLIRWIRLYGNSGMQNKALEYYKQVNFERMKNDQIIALMKTLFEDVKHAEMGTNCFYKIRLDELEDKRKVDLAEYFWKKDEKVVKTICMSMKDAKLGKMQLLRYYARQRDKEKKEKALELAKEVVTFPKYATAAMEIKAEVHEDLHQWGAAVSSWRQVNDPPRTSWEVAQCLLKDGKVEQAVGELRAIEQYFPKEAAEACFRVAKYWDHAGKRNQSNAVLREVMNKYEGHPVSRSAHNILEKRAKEAGVTIVDIGGGQEEKERR